MNEAIGNARLGKFSRGKGSFSNDGILWGALTWGTDSIVSSSPAESLLHGNLITHPEMVEVDPREVRELKQ